MISFCYFPMFVVTLRIPSMFCSVSLLASLLFWSYNLRIYCYYYY